ncbi:very long chain fatty acid elongase 5-like [Montipora foliosa]|uniref:very long chain fatty acid elongase 5-like n=1 Tax=Montipora foliosa TaxID=591990 RepID=UPI0035F16CFA
MGMTFVEFLHYFVNGVLKLRSLPVVVIYLLFVAISPLWIRVFRPLQLRKVLVAYNFGCSLISLYSVGFIVATLARNWPRSLFDVQEDALVKHAFWVYYMTKYFELLDTVFMVFRHRQRQISVLHVYHHASILMLSEYANTYGNWPAISVPLGLNGIIHVFMYFYYGQCALYPNQRPAWKKSLTQLQLIQFMIGLCHMIVGYLYHGWCYYGIFYELTMISLFGNFYYRAYLTERASAKKLE